MTDAWCPNCQQRVAPLRDPGARPTLVGWLLFGALFLASYRFHGTDVVQSVVIGLTVVGLPLVAWWLLRRAARRPRCPICRTERLTSSHPVPHG